MGKYLQQMEKQHGARGDERNQHQKEVESQRVTPPDIPTLKDLGINYNLASRVQTLAKVGDVVFERYVEEIRGSDNRTLATGARRCRIPG